MKGPDTIQGDHRLAPAPEAAAAQRRDRFFLPRDHNLFGTVKIHRHAHAVRGLHHGRVLGLDRVALKNSAPWCRPRTGVCVAVNFNSPEQIVVAGEKKAVAALAAAASGAGANG